jgi:hypothetical protein
MIWKERRKFDPLFFKHRAFDEPSTKRSGAQKIKTHGLYCKSIHSIAVVRCQPELP